MAGSIPRPARRARSCRPQYDQTGASPRRTGCRRHCRRPDPGAATPAGRGSLVGQSRVHRRSRASCDRGSGEGPALCCADPRSGAAGLPVALHLAGPRGTGSGRVTSQPAGIDCTFTATETTRTCGNVFSRPAPPGQAGGPSCSGLELPGLGVRDHLSGRPRSPAARPPCPRGLSLIHI